MLFRLNFILLAISRPVRLVVVTAPSAQMCAKPAAVKCADHDGDEEVSHERSSRFGLTIVSSGRRRARGRGAEYGVEGRYEREGQRPACFVMYVMLRWYLGQGLYHFEGRLTQKGEVTRKGRAAMVHEGG